jgi:hypothetical protein
VTLKSVSWVALIAVALAASGAGPTTVPDAAPAAPPVPVRPHGPYAMPNGLRPTMNQMLDILDVLKKETPDPANAEQSLKDLAAFERDVAICKLLTPPSIGRFKAEDRAGALDDYRIIWSNLMRAALDMEDAVKDNKPDQIKKLFEQVNESEAAGHDEFVPP